MRGIFSRQGIGFLESNHKHAQLALVRFFCLRELAYSSYTLSFLPVAVRLHHFGAYFLAFWHVFGHNDFMESFRQHLKHEFQKRAAKNEKYSLRAFAALLGINHATLSGMLTGKRAVTKVSAIKIAAKLGWGPELSLKLISAQNESDEVGATPYFLLQQDAFAAMSEWYFDAVLEFSKIPGALLEPRIIAKAFGITELQSRLALETLQRLELLVCDQNGAYQITKAQTTNILDHDFTTAAQRSYQKSVLEKSIEALELIPRRNRDHTSTTIAIDRKDVPEAKKLIAKFRHKIDRFLQKDPSAANEVYQLQVSFFPLSRSKQTQE